MMTPPPDWPQRVRRGLAFPPGIDGAEFEVVRMADGDVWQVNRATLEVFRAVGARWDQPSWHELPPLLRERVWEAARR